MISDSNGRRGLEPAARPRLRQDIASVRVQDGLVMASEAVGRVVMLDNVSGTIAELMDGTVTLADIAKDLAAIGVMDLEEALPRVLAIGVSLDMDGFFTDSATDLRGRRVDVTIPDDSCLAKRMGLGAGWIAQVSPPGASPFRFGATVDSVVDDLVDDLRNLGCAVDAPDGTPTDLLFLRASQGKVPRLQQLFDTVDIRWHVGRDYDEAVRALRSSVFARAELNNGVWIEGMSLRKDNQVLLVHPSLAEKAHAARPRFSRAGFTPMAGGLLRVQGDKLILPSDRTSSTGSEGSILRPVGMLMPTMEDSSIMRAALHLCRLWNQAHLDAFAPIVRSLRSFLVGLEDELPIDQIADAFERS